MVIAGISVIVVGGGPGGLAAAIALSQRGADVELIEAKSDWSVAGWGLALTGPALRALDSLGVADTLIDAGYGLNTLYNRDINGEVIGTQDFPRLLGAGRPAQVGIGRPRLTSVLREAAGSAGVKIRNGVAMESITRSTSSTVVSLADGTSSSADLVVGADGVFSRTRSELGIALEPSYSGQMIWRAIVPRPEWATGISTFSGGRNNAGLIPISEEDAYCFASENTGPSAYADHELADRMRELLAPFGGKVAEVRELIRDSSMVVRRPAHTLWVPPPWHLDRVALLGDAVHSPSPQLVSGTAMAVEDAVVLAEELARADDVDAGLEEYSARRSPRCEHIVRTSLEISKLEQTGRYGETYALHGRAHAVAAQAI